MWYTLPLFFTVPNFYTTPSCPSIPQIRYVRSVRSLPYLLQRQDRILPDSGHPFECNTDLPSYDKRARQSLSVPASALRLLRVSRKDSVTEGLIITHFPYFIKPSHNLGT